MSWPAEQSLRFPVGTSDVPLLWRPQTAPGAHQGSKPMHTGGPPLWCRDGPLYSADVKTEWSYASTPPYGFTVCSDKFTFTFISACSFGNTVVLKWQQSDSHSYIYIWTHFNLSSFFCTESALILQTKVLFNHICYKVNQSFLCFSSVKWPQIRKWLFNMWWYNGIKIQMFY